MIVDFAKKYNDRSKKMGIWLNYLIIWLFYHDRV